MGGPFVYPILLFSLPLSGRSPDMTEILLTRTLSLNSINQSINQYLNSLPTGKLCMLFCHMLIFFKIIFFEKLFQEYHQHVKQC